MRWVNDIFPNGVTLLSIYNGSSKSPFFDMGMDITVFRRGSGQRSPGHVTIETDSQYSVEYALSVPDSCLELLAGLVRSLGFEPYADAGESVFSMEPSSVCTWPSDGAKSLFSENEQPRAGDKSTATVTVSMVMIPISMYGGSYPNFRKLILMVHNFKPSAVWGRSLLAMQWL